MLKNVVDQVFPFKIKMPSWKKVLEKKRTKLKNLNYPLGCLLPCNVYNIIKLIIVILTRYMNRLCVVTAIVGVCAEFLVSAIEDVTQVWHISETFVGKYFV